MFLNKEKLERFFNGLLNKSKLKWKSVRKIAINFLCKNLIILSNIMHCARLWNKFQTKLKLTVMLENNSTKNHQLGLLHRLMLMALLWKKLWRFLKPKWNKLKRWRKGNFLSYKVKNKNQKWLKNKVQRGSSIYSKNFKNNQIKNHWHQQNKVQNTYLTNQHLLYPTHHLLKKM